MGWIKKESLARISTVQLYRLSVGVMGSVINL